MELDQIVKRLDWLDEEHRKDKLALNTIKTQWDTIEGEFKSIRERLKELSSEMSHLVTVEGRMEQFNTALARHRKEINLFISDLEKRREENQAEVDKRYRLEFENINKSLAETKKIRDPIVEIKRELKGLSEEDFRLSRQMTGWEKRLQDVTKISEDTQLSYRASEENRRQDSKRLFDLQGEITAARKRIDEVREKTDVFTDNSRRVETRMTELMSSEADRRQSQINFTETQARLQVERDRTWKEWQERFDTLSKQTDSLDTQLQAWDAAQRTIKRAQEAYEQITAKFERRINEITEIQRLAEDRFRQEWVTFKADDQKRWTSYTLSQDETHKEVRTEVKRIEERVTTIEDLAQTQQDILQQTKEANEQMLQALLAQIHELLSAYERIASSTK